MKKLILIISYLVVAFLSILWSFENQDKLTFFKKILKDKKENLIKDTFFITANSFEVKLTRVLDIEERTASVFYDGKSNKFNPSDLIIYAQNGLLIKNNKSKKIELPKNFTTIFNGGIKTIFYIKDTPFGLHSSKDGECIYIAISNLDTSNEIFKTKCLDRKYDSIDLNGMGSNNLKFENNLLLSIGTPENETNINSFLAQDKNSYIGKILKIDMSEFNQSNSDNFKLSPKIFSSGHRNPQGLTMINDSIFSVEHGPKGGDELNKIIEGENYGWPEVSYGTNYLYFKEGESIDNNHENNKFKEPLFAFVPSIAISDLSECSIILKKYYKKNCLMALSLSGNSLREGKSLIIFLLNEAMDKVNSIEKIKLKEGRFRHFVVNKNKKLFEDVNGHFYISADGDGIYKLEIINFR